MSLEHLEQSSTRRSPDKRLFRPSRLAVVLLILLVLAEITLQLFGARVPGRVDAAEVLNVKEGRYELKKGASFSSGDSTISINDSGMRGPMPDKNLLKIGVVGGDTVFGARIGNEEKTLTASLERHLSVGGIKRFQFLNGGVPRMNLAHAKERIETSLIPNGVRAVVLFVGVDDLIGLMQEESALPDPVAAKSSFLDNIALWRLLSPERDDDATAQSPIAGDLPAQGPSQEQIAAMKRRIFVYLRDIIRLCQDQGIGLMLVSEPSAAYSVSQKMEAERVGLASRVNLDPNEMRRLCNEVATLLSLWETRDNVWFYNMAENFYKSRNADALEEYHYGAFDPVLGVGLQQAGTDRASKLLGDYLRSNPPWILRQARKP